MVNIIIKKLLNCDNTFKNKTPPFFLLVDTNFIYFALKNKLDLHESFLECFSGKIIICVSSCVVSELEKLGSKFRLALKILRDDRIIKLDCHHKLDTIYADDCIFETVLHNPSFIVATCDKGLKRRLNELKNVALVLIKKKKFILATKI